MRKEFLTRREGLQTGGKPSTGWHLPLNLSALVLFVVFVSPLSCLCLAFASSLATLKVAMWMFLELGYLFRSCLCSCLVVSCVVSSLVLSYLLYSSRLFSSRLFSSLVFFSLVLSSLGWLFYCLLFSSVVFTCLRCAQPLVNRQLGPGGPRNTGARSCSSLFLEVVFVFVVL